MELSHGNPLYFPKAASPRARGREDTCATSLFSCDANLSKVCLVMLRREKLAFPAQLSTVVAFSQRRSRLCKQRSIRKCSLGKEFHP